MDKKEKIKPPKRIWLLFQPLAVFEFIIFIFLVPFLLIGGRKGNGCPVLVLPGFLVGDWYMWPMRIILRLKGYQVYGWDNGMSKGYRGEINNLLIKKTKKISKENNGQQVALIGFSLGGIYARNIASNCPSLVSRVFTLSSPFMNINSSINIQNIYRFISGKRIEEDIPRKTATKIKKKLPMITISFYSLFDGIVSPKSCLEPEDYRTFNYKIFSTHCGLPFNYFVMKIILEKLNEK